MSAFPERLKAWRKRARLKGEEAAVKLGVGRSYYSRLENGKKEPGKFLVEKFELLEAEPKRNVPSVHIPTTAHRGSAVQETRVVPIGNYRSPRIALRAALAEKGMTAGDLAKKMGYDSAIVDNMINGAGKLSKNTLMAMAPFLDLDTEYMLSGSEKPPIINRGGIEGTFGDTPNVILPGSKKTRNIPLLSWAAAGQLGDSLATDEAWDGEAVPSNVPGRAFAVEIVGDSMYPEISPGDYAVVRKDLEPRAGQTVLVQTIHGQVLCKRYSTRDGDKLVILSSVNKSYEPYEIPASDIAWIYPVKQVIKNYE